MDRAALARHLEARAAAGSSVLLVGPPGIGKTTLVSVFRRTMPGAAVVAPSVTARRIPLGALSVVLPPSVCSRRTASQRLSTAAEYFARDRTRRLFVVDDLHDLDEESLVLLHNLVLTESIQVVASSRSGSELPAVVTVLERAGAIEVVDVPPLTASEVRRVVRDHVDSSMISADAIVQLHEASDGNPLLLVELIRQALAEGTLVDRAGAWTLTKVPLTETISSQLRRRSAQWPPAVVDVAARVACCGALPIDLIEDLCDSSALTAAKSVGAVQAIDDAVHLAHPLLADVVTETVTRDRRTKLMIDTINFLQTHHHDEIRWATVAAALTLELSDDDGVDTATLLAIAERMMNTNRARPDLTERMLASRQQSSAEQAGLLRRLRATRGEPMSSTRSITAEQALGKADGFMLGLNDATDVVDDLTSAADGADGTQQAMLRCYALMIRLWTGEALEPIVERMLDYDEQASNEAVGVSVMSACAGLAALGRFEDILCIVQKTEGSVVAPHHALRAGYSIVEATVHLEGRAGAERVLDEKLPASIGQLIDVGSVYRSFWRAQLGLIAARPELAIDHLADLIARSEGSDGGGIRTYASLLLELAAAWAGQASGQLTSFSVPARGRLCAQKYDIAHAEHLLVRGELGLARQVALDATAAAARADHRFDALASAAIASLIEPSAELARLAVRVGRACQGRISGLLTTAVVALAEGDSVGAADTAEALVAAGWDHFGLELWIRATALLRSNGYRARALDGDENIRRLVESGAKPLRPSEQPAAQVQLTRREHEVALLAARGLTTRDVAERLRMSQRTAETHLHRAYRKLQVSDRSNLAELGFA